MLTLVVVRCINAMELKLKRNLVCHQVIPYNFRFHDGITVMTMAFRRSFAKKMPAVFSVMQNVKPPVEFTQAGSVGHELLPANFIYGAKTRIGGFYHRVISYDAGIIVR